MAIALSVFGVAFAAFCILFTVRIVNSDELRAKLWNARATFPIVGVAGVATVCAAYLFIRRDAGNRNQSFGCSLIALLDTSSGCMGGLGLVIMMAAQCVVGAGASVPARKMPPRSQSRWSNLVLTGPT